MRDQRHETLTALFIYRSDDVTAPKSPKKPIDQYSENSLNVPVYEIISAAMARSTKSTAELAGEMGYKTPNILSMLKTGAMRLPQNKVVTVGKPLGIDTTYLLRVVDRENNTNYAEVIEKAIDRPLISDNEMKLPLMQRAVSHGLDIDIDAYPEQRAVIERALIEVCDMEWQRHRAHMKNIMKPKKEGGGEGSESAPTV